MQDTNKYKSGETTTDTDMILIVVESQPPSTGFLGMSHREHRSDKRGCEYSHKVLVHEMGTIDGLEWDKWVGIKENEMSVQIIAACRN